MNKRKEVLSPNLLITNYCNQHCAYCFAQEEMGRSKIKEMSIKNFNRLSDWLLKNKINTLRLMGGEPTLHTHFVKIVNDSVKKFDTIVVFSNGLIPSKSLEVIQKNIKKFSFNFNIGTEAFLNDKNKRRKIVDLITDLANKTSVNIGFTFFDLDQDCTNLYNDFSDDTIKLMGIRFGIAKVVIGQKPLFKRKDYYKIGKKVSELVRLFKNRGFKEIHLDCGLQKDMFTKSDLAYILKNVHFRGWGCDGKWSSFDIEPDMTTFPCFPFYKIRKEGDLSCIFGN
jgi:sulfatase maturation enzyme AslB (radical SAM superfamily)